MAVLEAPHALSIIPRQYNFIVIGAGGNGGHLVPNLCRLIASTKHISCSLVVCDGDDVEEKNVSRQNFVMSDVGKNKAMVMAERYGTAFGIPVGYCDTYIENAYTLIDMADTQRASGGVSVVIGCVDNNKTRQIIHEWFVKTTNAVWLDVGNNEFIGQAVLGYNIMSVMQDEVPNAAYPFYCPPVTVRYPDILQDKGTKFNSELSCDELAVSAPQSIMTNILAASCAMMMLTPIITTNTGLTFTEVAFNTKTGMVVPKPNTPSVFAQYK